MEKFDTTKSLFEMTDKEMNVDGWACACIIDYLTELINNNQALQFQRAQPDQQSYMILSPNTTPDNKYRLTYFDQYGASGHTEYATAEEAARGIFQELPHKQRYIIPEKIIKKGAC